MNRWDCVLKRLPDGDVTGAEVGVYTGIMSAELLKRPDLTLYMVDIWPNIGSSHAKIKAEAATKFAKTRRVLVQMPSLMAAPSIFDASLDFVFLDADHSYEAVKADIEAWRPKLKRGGWLCGHDFAKQRHGVRQAVEELCPGFELDDDDTWFLKKEDGGVASLGYELLMKGGW